jgi:hypothetical protein
VLPQYEALYQRAFLWDENGRLFALVLKANFASVTTWASVIWGI